MSRVSGFHQLVHPALVCSHPNRAHAAPATYEPFLKRPPLGPALYKGSSLGKFRLRGDSMTRPPGPWPPPTPPRRHPTDPPMPPGRPPPGLFPHGPGSRPSPGKLPRCQIFRMKRKIVLIVRSTPRARVQTTQNKRRFYLAGLSLRAGRMGS